MTGFGTLAITAGPAMQQPMQHGFPQPSMMQQGMPQPGMQMPGMQPAMPGLMMTPGF